MSSQHTSIHNDEETPLQPSSSSSIINNQKVNTMLSSSSHWRIWETVTTLEQRANESSFYSTESLRVASILREWGMKWGGQDGWQSLLNKHSLLHEAEESIVALHYLFHNNNMIHKNNNNNDNKFIAVDVCGGKGLFSMLLSYYISKDFKYEDDNTKMKSCDYIILLEKSTSIDWSHVNAVNETCHIDHRPRIEVWSDTNLHDYDTVLQRFEVLPYPLALTGIHLCKQLGPSFCSLVNGLGLTKCIYACLAPCCLPRKVTCQKHKKNKDTSYIIPIQLYETITCRQERRDYMKRRKATKHKDLKKGPCVLCYDVNHALLACPNWDNQAEEQQIKLKQIDHAQRVPCWKCGIFGHYKADCTSATTSSRPIAKFPPTMSLDVSNLLQEQSSEALCDDPSSIDNVSSSPFDMYCRLLATTFQDRAIQVVQAGLSENENNYSHNHGKSSKRSKHQEGNWNACRKSLFLVTQ